MQGVPERWPGYVIKAKSLEAKPSRQTKGCPQGLLGLLKASPEADFFIEKVQQDPNLTKLIFNVLFLGVLSANIQISARFTEAEQVRQRRRK